MDLQKHGTKSTQYDMTAIYSVASFTLHGIEEKKRSLDATNAITSNFEVEIKNKGRTKISLGTKLHDHPICLSLITSYSLELMIQGGSLT